MIEGKYVESFKLFVTPLLHPTPTTWLRVLTTMNIQDLIIHIIIHIGLHHIKDSSVSAATSYAVLIDAGSSSSKGKVYSLVTSGFPGDLPVLDLVHNNRLTPGLGTLAGDVSAIDTHVATLLFEARQHIPDDQVEVTPIYVMATAGRYWNIRCRLMGSLDEDETSGVD